MALQDLNSGEQEAEFERPQMRRRSRNQMMMPPPEEEEYMQPPPPPRFSSSSGRRSYGRSVSMEEPQPPPRYSAATSLADEVLYGGPRRDEPRRGGGSAASFEPPPPAASTGWKDTEDVDAMIADLKKKTSGRDMRQVLRDIEHSSSGGGGGMDYGSQFADDRRSAVGFGADYDDDFERGGGGGLSTRNGDGSGSRQLGISRGGFPRGGEEGPAGMGDWKGGGGRRRSTARNSSVDDVKGVVPPPARSRWRAAASSPPPRPSTQRTSFDVGDGGEERSRGKFKSGGGTGGGETEFGVGERRSFGAGRRSLGNRMRIASPIEGEDSD